MIEVQVEQTQMTIRAYMYEVDALKSDKPYGAWLHGPDGEMLGCLAHECATEGEALQEAASVLEILAMQARTEAA